MFTILGFGFPTHSFSTINPSPYRFGRQALTAATAQPLPGYLTPSGVRTYPSSLVTTHYLHFYKYFEAIAILLHVVVSSCPYTTAPTSGSSGYVSKVPSENGIQGSYRFITSNSPPIALRS